MAGDIEYESGVRIFRKYVKIFFEEIEERFFFFGVGGDGEEWAVAVVILVIIEQSEYQAVYFVA